VARRRAGPVGAAGGVRRERRAACVAGGAIGAAGGVHGFGQRGGPWPAAGAAAGRLVDAVGGTGPRAF